ncbi:MAG: glycoside hydrolase family 15 protein [Gaiellales bacterium]
MAADVSHADAETAPCISDYGFLSDRVTACLVSRGGSVDWWCVPRLDSGSCFGRLLDPEQGGSMSISPTAAHEVSRSYIDGSLVLETTMRTRAGEITLTDMLALGRDGGADEQGHMVRLVEGRRGIVRMRAHISPRFDYAEVRPWIRRTAPGRYHAIGGNDALALWSSTGLEPAGDHSLESEFTLRAGERAAFSLRYLPPHTLDQDDRDVNLETLDRLLQQTVSWWQRWSGAGRDPGPPDSSTLRSALVLCGLANASTGAMAAAATTSLPEEVGGSRNWDYRYSWIRDSTLAVRALAELGFEAEADEFRKFIQRSAAGHVDDLQIAYGVGGERRLTEFELPLAGYRRSLPVRAGNDAAQQQQNDVLGELVLLAWRWHERGNSPDDDTWRFIADLAEAAVARWQEPDSGIWEERGSKHHLVHSKLMCWAALDRGAALADECLRRAPVRRWRRERDKIAKAVERDGYDRRRRTFRRSFGSRQVDAALLLIPHTGFVDVADERMVGTVDAIMADLDDGGLLRRYTASDGLRGGEGAFVACSFWLVECLAGQGRLTEARQVFERAVSTSNDLGLYSEEFDPHAGHMLGNFPQALTHLSHIAATVAMQRAVAAEHVPLEAPPAGG